MSQLRLAIDLGAGSGRAVVGGISDGRVRLREVHRFEYPARQRAGHLRWDAEALFGGLRWGLRAAGTMAAAEGADLASVGVDSWAVDYGLLDAQGRLLEEPVCYRDPRTDGVLDDVLRIVPRAELFARTGNHVLKLNTLYQLVAHGREGFPSAAVRLLMVPDLCHHFLCSSQTGEYTNATTTQILNAETGRWDDGLVERLGLPRALLPEVLPAGQRLGRLQPARAAELDLTELEVIAPATHDTASAVAGTPLQPGWAYISSGTWSLVGVERAAPLLGAAVGEANFTNEGGPYGTTRLLKNVMGLWLLESCRREWAAAGRGQTLDELLLAVAAARGFPGFVYPDAERFFSPASMLCEVRRALGETGQPEPEHPAIVAKVVLDSLAMRYASVVCAIEKLTGREVAGIHIVGGGSQNDYLNQATANAADRPVLAGPREATAAGNFLVQSIAAGDVASLEEGRHLLGRSLPSRRFEPREARAWAAVAPRYRELEEAAC